MRIFTTRAMIGRLAARKPAAEEAPTPDSSDADPVAPAVPEAKADGPNAATHAVRLDGEAQRFVDKAIGNATPHPVAVTRAQAHTALPQGAGPERTLTPNPHCRPGEHDLQPH